jgi:hypothetical protein
MIRSVVLALTLAAILSAQTSSIKRDWSKNPAIVQADTTDSIYVIGDPHADPARLSAVLVGAKIIAAVPPQPSAVNWTAGKSIVVFTGDLIDKGTSSLGVIALIQALQEAAAEAGGRVIVTMGNHEAEFLADPTADKTSEFQQELKAAGKNPADVAAGHDDLGTFLCQLPFGARVNDWFFSHGGNTAGRTLSQLISDLQAGVDKDGFSTSQLIGDDSLLEARLGDSPWFQPNGANAQSTLQAYCNALGVKHIVQGHQPGKVQFDDGTKRSSGEMFQRYGLIFLEDTGMSQGVEDSHGAALLISPKKQTASAICFDGAATLIWDNQAHKDQGGVAPCGGK